MNYTTQITVAIINLWSTKKWLKKYFRIWKLMLWGLKMVMRAKKYRPLGYERVYLPLYKVADASFHIQGDDIMFVFWPSITFGNIFQLIEKQGYQIY